SVIDDPVRRHIHARRPPGAGMAKSADQLVLQKAPDQQRDAPPDECRSPAAPHRFERDHRQWAQEEGLHWRAGEPAQHLIHGHPPRFRHLVAVTVWRLSSPQAREDAPMKYIRVHAVLAVLGAAIALAMSPAAAQQPYYKGKRLTVLINFAAGGPADIESRIFARHLVKHIDGAPTLVIQNMDGAGGLIGAQYLGEVAA